MTKFSKFWLIITLAFMSAIAPLSTDMYLPALSKVQESFQTSEFYTQLSLSSFFIAFALGQLIYGPLSDIFGRKKPLYAGIAIFIISSIACVSFDSIYAFIFFRFTQALGGCAGVVIARAIINDKFEFKEGAAVLSLMMVVGSIAPMLAPSFGGILLELASWKSIFITLFALGGVLIFMVIFVLKESAVIDKSLQLSAKSIVQNYLFILKDRRFVIFMLSSALALGAMFAYITGSSFVFMRYFGLSHTIFGIIFGVNACSMVIASILNAKFTQIFSPFVILQNAFIAMITLSFLLIIAGIFENFWAFEILLFLLLMTKGFIIPNAVVLAMARFRNKSGSASAVLGATQFALAGFISFLVGFFGANTPLLLALVMVFCVIIAFMIFISINRKNFKNFVKIFDLFR